MRSTKFASGRARSPSAPSLGGRPPAGAGFLPTRVDFSAQELIPFLSLPNQREPIAADQCLCRERARIIVRRHPKTVRARAHYREQIAFVQVGHFPVERKKIAGFAYRPDDIDPTNLPLPLILRLNNRHNFVIALI